MTAPSTIAHAPSRSHSVSADAIDAAVAVACGRIAPTWPLDRFIAVNPLWHRVDRPLSIVAAELAARQGARLVMPLDYYRERWRAGDIVRSDITDAVAELAEPTSARWIESLLDRGGPSDGVDRRLAVVDVADRRHVEPRAMTWRDYVVGDISQTCAAYFDDGQAQVTGDREGGLFATWRRAAVRSRGPAWSMGCRDWRRHAASIPESAESMIHMAVADLGVPQPELDAYFDMLLLDTLGWAAWCAYLDWTGASTDHRPMRDLLAIRLAWEWCLHRIGGDELDRGWTQAMAAWPKVDAAANDHREAWIMQRAHELAWQRIVVSRLADGQATVRARPTVTVQAVLCIDVRSEPLRRAIEAALPSAQTLGFAGFFGLPLAHRASGAAGVWPHLPGLLSPRWLATDAGIDEDAAIRQRIAGERDGAWASFRQQPSAGFSFVDALGPSYAGKLLLDTLGVARPRHWGARGLRADEATANRPRVVEVIDGGRAPTVDELADACAGALRGMSLTRGFAPLVLLCGHGSTSCNNPLAAGLDCGACCGQTGEVSARVLAGLLDDPEIRGALAQRGIVIDDSTWFLAGLHDTTTDDIALFDLDRVPPSHTRALAELRASLTDASARARRHRAPRLDIRGQSDAELHAAFVRRSRDWAEVRPEWGLAGNAAFIAAPRDRTRGCDLEGRAFLHEYVHADDPELAVLETIMTAPLVVAHWINLQYYASTVDNARYGSGDKVLHDVVGGHIGVFEGNGGDLRIGLPMQSLHDGQRWVHEPLRLLAVIEAPRDAIDLVLRRHDRVQQLVDHGWINLIQLDDHGRPSRRRNGAWQRVETAPSSSPSISGTRCDAPPPGG